MRNYPVISWHQDGRILDAAVRMAVALDNTVFIGIFRVHHYFVVKVYSRVVHIMQLCLPCLGKLAGEQDSNILIPVINSMCSWKFSNFLWVA